MNQWTDHRPVFLIRDSKVKVGFGNGPPDITSSSFQA